MAAAIDRFNDLQGNILRKHGRRYAAHLFLRFDAAQQSEIKRWIADFAAAEIPTCAGQLAGTHAEGSFANLMLSASGYRALGFDAPAGRAFQGGMKRANLNDPPVSEWEQPYRHDLDALIILADDDAERLNQRISTIESARRLICVLAIEMGAELAGGIEHFGFVDGISQPLFLDEEIAQAMDCQPDKLLWNPATPLQVVLARDPYGDGEQSYGSYFVFRKLEQDVASFEQGVQKMAAQLGVNELLAGAMVVGRFKDGTPLAQSTENGLGPVNNFAYSEDPAGSKCPFASHVRRVNPRAELDHVAHTPDWQNRIARRGMPYGEPGQAPVGLLFMCFQSDIGQQFELIQNNWCNFPHFPMRRTGKDPLVGQRNSWDHSEGQRWSPVPANIEQEEPVTFAFPDCVRMRGGEYFFAPSPSFLLGLRNR